MTCPFPKFVDNRQRKRKYDDLSGLHFGKLKVLYRSDDEIMTNGNHTLRYACECGNYTLVRGTALKRGSTVTCKHCATKESMKGVNLEDLTGQHFGRWTVIKRGPDLIEPNGRPATRWYCVCQCGSEDLIRAHSLKDGMSLSCGCLKWILYKLFGILKVNILVNG